MGSSGIRARSAARPAPPLRRRPPPPRSSWRRSVRTRTIGGRSPYVWMAERLGLRRARRRAAREVDVEVLGGAKQSGHVQNTKRLAQPTCQVRRIEGARSGSNPIPCRSCHCLSSALPPSSRARPLQPGSAPQSRRLGPPPQSASRLPGVPPPTDTACEGR